MKKTRIRLVLSYDGTPFKGWQKQKNTAMTVQHCLEKALGKISGRPVQVVGAGRTDAGAHALGQTAHFDLVEEIPSDQLLRGLNGLTPQALSCHKLWKAPPGFHAKNSALHRRYHYVIFNTKTPSAIRRNYGLWRPQPVHFENLNKTARFLKGQKDFKSFQNTGTAVKSTVCVIHWARWVWARPGLLVFQIQGKSFLKQMVRNLVGAQLSLMKKENPIDDLENIFKAKDRKKAPPTAPALGLFLYKVAYPPSLDKQCCRF